MEYGTLRDDEVEKLTNTHSDLCSNCKVPNISNQIHCKTGGIRKIKIKMMSTRSMKKNMVMIFSLSCVNLRTLDSAGYIFLKLRLCLKGIMMMT